MNVSQKDFEFMVDIMTRDIIAELMKVQHVDLETAFGLFYNSKTFEALNRPSTGLFFQSPKYVYSILETEIKTGKMG